MLGMSSSGRTSSEATGSHPAPGAGPSACWAILAISRGSAKLEFCEHVPVDLAFWTAIRPAMLLCDFCYQTAQALAEDIRCAACGQPAGDPVQDAVVVARVAAWLGAYFYLCALCAELDRL